jgi:hypothetical protein
MRKRAIAAKKPCEGARVGVVVATAGQSAEAYCHWTRPPKPSSAESLAGGRAVTGHHLLHGSVDVYNARTLACPAT